MSHVRGGHHTHRAANRICLGLPARVRYRHDAVVCKLDPCRTSKAPSQVRHGVSPRETFDSGTEEVLANACERRLQQEGRHLTRNVEWRKLVRRSETLHAHGGALVTGQQCARSGSAQCFGTKHRCKSDAKKTPNASPHKVTSQGNQAKQTRHERT